VLDVGVPKVDRGETLPPPPPATHSLTAVERGGLGGDPERVPRLEVGEAQPNPYISSGGSLPLFTEPLGGSWRGRTSYPLPVGPGRQGRGALGVPIFSIYLE